MKVLSSTPWVNGLAGVLIFGGSLPATRMALQGFEPRFLTFARAPIAGLAGISYIGCAATVSAMARPCRTVRHRHRQSSPADCLGTGA